MESNIILSIPFEYFGKNISTNFFQPLLSESQIKQINQKSITYTYVSNYSKGYSLCFENNILNSIFYYNEGIQHFKEYKGVLPYNISLSKMKNVDIVKYLGDTPKKGGGKYPIYLNYSHLGIEITFLNSNWNDTDNPIIFISIFEKDKSRYYCALCTKQITDNNTELFKCDNKSCNIIYYCSLECKSQHIKYHLEYCNNK